MNLVERVKAILMQPKLEWPVIEREPATPNYLFPNYVMILAAIPPVCSFIGGVLIGFGPYRMGIFSGLVNAIIIYVLTLGGVFITAYIIDYLAGVFGGQKNFDNAMRVSAYAPTAAWIAGVFNIIPLLGILSLLGLYSLYLMHTGLVALMRPAAEKAVIYTIAVIVCVIVIWLVIVGVPAMLFGIGLPR